MLYVDHRAPIITGITGSVWSQIFCSCVAICFCFAVTSVDFHWFRSGVAVGLAKCSQLPVGVPS